MPKQRKDFLLNPFIIAIVAVIVIFALFNFWQNIQKMERLENRIESVKEEIKKTEAENSELEEQLENTNDPEYIEEVAREKLGLVKPGEMLLVPVEEDTDEEAEDKEE
ncbi:MAG: FtsB family cell division protein [Halanaerobium sp.]